MCAKSPLVGVVSVEQEKDFLLRLGVEDYDLQDLQPASLVPSFWPSKSERIAVCLPQRAAGDLKAPHCGWHEGEVAQLPPPAKKKGPKWVNIRWDDKRINRGCRSWIDASKVAWIPRFCLKAGEGEHAAPSAQGSWLRSAAARCARPVQQADPEQVFLRNWWTEARRGVVRLSTTPSAVAAELRELHVARQFLASRMEDQRFWRAVNRGTSSLEELDMPPSFLSAIREARQRGAVYISPFGVYVAPSQVVPGELGLHSLVLFHPCEFVGSWEGEWLWETEKERYRKSGDAQSRTLSEFPNSAAILKYGMRFQNVDTIDGTRKTVTAMIDACRGCDELSLKQVCERNEPFGFMNEPPVGQSANCEVQSRVNLLEEPANGNRYSLLIVAMLPLAPHFEILIHYGARYDRSYGTGDRCPQLFAGLPFQSPAHGDFGALGPQDPGQAESSTAVPSTPMSTASAASSAQDPAPARVSQRLRERREREAASGGERGTKRRRAFLDSAALQSSRDLPSPGDWVYVHLAPCTEVTVPYAGWFEAMVVSVSECTGQAVLRWSHERVCSGLSSKLSLLEARWVPCAGSDVVALPVGESPLVWLERAAASVLPECEAPALQIFFARWWSEARWGFVRFTVTPSEVIDKLQELEEVRRFIATVGDDDAFWRSVSDGTHDSSVLPPAVLDAISEAQRRGASCFFKQGLFLARSRLDPSRCGLHTLSLLHPARYIGVFDMRTEAQQACPLKTPRCKRWKAQTLSSTGIAGGPGSRTPLASLAAPSAGCTPNCLLTPVPGRKAQGVLVTLLPVLPMSELLSMHTISVGPTCPSGLFAELSVRAIGVP